MTVANSTIAYNVANGIGSYGVSGVNNDDIMTVNNSLIAHNAGIDVGGIASSFGAYNLIGVCASGALVNGVNGNQVGVTDPGLDPNGLQNNGGPTQTIALLPGSPAIDAGSNTLAVDPSTGLPLTTDQRGPGFPRIVGKAVDIGAYEFPVTAYVVVTTQPPATVTAGSGFGLTVAVEDSLGNVDTSFNGTVTVALASNPIGGTVGGTLSVTAQSGVATFSGLTLNEPGGYTLSVSSSGLVTATTRAFDVQTSNGTPTWTVNSLGDSGTGSGPLGDLRYVITQVDQTTGDNTINFGVTGTITLNSALPALSNTTGVTDIEGPGANLLTVSGNNAVGVFTVDTGVTATLTGLTISSGFSPGIDDYYGSTMAVTNCTIDNNSDGGIWNNGALTVSNSTIADNVGGVICFGGTLTVTNSTIADNSSSNVGGIYSSGGMVTVTNSTIDNNEALNFYGGGIDDYGSTMAVTNCTIDNNSAGSNGGGGIYSSGTLTVTNSTIADNSASVGYGGGLLAVGSSTPLLDNTLIALNTSGVGSAATPDDIAGTVSSASAYNLIGTGGSGGLVNGINGNQVGVADPGLDPRDCRTTADRPRPSPS